MQLRSEDQACNAGTVTHLLTLNYPNAAIFCFQDSVS